MTQLFLDSDLDFEVDPKDRIVRCGVCEKYFIKKDYIRHFMTNHSKNSSKERNSPDSFVEKKTKKIKLRKTTRKYETDLVSSPSKLQYRCHLCENKSCKSRYGLYSHYSFIHYKAEILGLAGPGDKCPYCGKKFRSVNRVAHIGIVHGGLEKFLPEHLHIKSSTSKSSPIRESPPEALDSSIQNEETVEDHDQSVSAPSVMEGIIVDEEDKDEAEATKEVLKSSVTSVDGLIASSPGNPHKRQRLDSESHSVTSPPPQTPDFLSQGDDSNLSLSSMSTAVTETVQLTDVHQDSQKMMWMMEEKSQIEISTFNNNLRSLFDDSDDSDF